MFHLMSCAADLILRSERSRSFLNHPFRFEQNINISKCKSRGEITCGRPFPIFCEGLNDTRERERHSLSFDYSVNNKQGKTVPSGTSALHQVRKKGCLVILLNLLSGHQRVDSEYFS